MSYMHRVFALSLALALGAAAPTMAADQDAATAFARLLDEAWESDLRESPLFATRAGDNRYNDRLPHVSVADERRRLAEKRDRLERLGRIDRDELGREDRENYDIFLEVLTTDVKELEFETYLMPITNRSGFHVSFPELPDHVPLDSVQDYENYVARLGLFDAYAGEHIELMRAGVEKGFVLPAVVLAGYRKAIEAHIVDDPSDSLLYGPFRRFPDTVGEEDRKRLERAGRDAIGSSVVPGYRRFLEFMEGQYVPAARATIGASELPRGREYYRFAIRKFTTLDLTAEEVYQTGMNEVRRIRAEMLDVIRKTGFDGDFAAFVEHLRTDPRFYAPSAEQLQKEVAFILKRMDGELPRMFKKLPRTPYGIREVPSYIAPRSTAAYYQMPAGDGSRAGFYFINTYDLKSRPLYGLEALSFHEAVPGHHLQLALQQELTDLPNFRRFSGFTSHIEGWALYAERLGLELGFYTDPYSDFGRLTYEMWRACRLVVDTGIHDLGWTRERAIEFMAENTALSMHNIEAEVDRYISWPGQALAYKIGELKIRELRARAEEHLGERFDVREFHDVVLRSGSIPLGMLEKNVNAYLESKS